MKHNVEDLIRRADELAGERMTWENQWRDVAKYCSPVKYKDFQNATKGSKVDKEIYDSTPRMAVQVFAAGLHGYLTNPSARWFSLGVKNSRLQNSYQAQDWLKECEETIFATLNGSNFNQQIHETYLDFGTFGTPCMYVSEDIKDVVRFYTRMITEVYLSENNEGRIDTAFRRFTLTSRQAYQTWGKNAGEVVDSLISNKKFQDNIEFLHIVLPREEYDQRKRDRVNMPWASLWVEISKKRLIDEGGYMEFPFLCPRFSKLPGQVWGYSPAMVALPDIKMLNEMGKTMIKGAHRAVAPPLILPDDGYVLPFKRTPDAINFKDAASQSGIDVLEFKGNLPYGKEEQNEIRAQIRQSFFVDLFLMLGQLDKNMTAKEVSERVGERMLILGPILGRLMDELLNPLIVRTFNILMRNGLLPPPPPVLEGVEYEIEYISPLARAQKMVQVDNIRGMIAVVQEMAQALPDVLDRIDGDKTVKEIAEIHNVQDLMRSDEEVNQIRQQRAQAAQAQQALEMASQGGEAATKIKEAME